MGSTTTNAASRKKSKLKTNQKNLVLLWANSEQTQTAFCHQQQIALSSFSTWVQKARATSLIEPRTNSKRRAKPKEASIPEGFVQATLKDNQDRSRSSMTRSLIIRTSYGLTIEVPL